MPAIRAQNFEVQGRLRSKGRVETDSSMQVPFTVAVKGDNWYIEVIQINGMQESASGDGKVVYQIRAFDPKVPVSTNGITAEVFPGGYPFNGLPVMNMPWFAYASATFLARNSNTVPCVPIFHARSDPLALFYRSVIDVSTDSPRLPLKARFQTGNPLWQSVLTHSDGVLQFTNYKLLIDDPLRKKAYGEIPDGFVGATYEVSQSTNFAGQTLPLVFNFKMFASTDPQGTPMKLIEWEGRAESITRCDRASLMPEIRPPGNMLVLDFRLRDKDYSIDGVRYWRTNEWPINVPANGEALLQAKREYVRQGNTRPINPFRNGVGAFAVMVIIGALPLGIFLLRRAGNRQTT